VKCRRILFAGYEYDHAGTGGLDWRGRKYFDEAVAAQFQTEFRRKFI
jgi:hypothetical protein